MGQSLPRARAIWCGGALILLAALAACTTDDVMSLRPDVDVGAQTAAVPARGLQSLVPSNPMMAAYPRLETPAAPTLTMSADDIACRRDLQKLGVQFRSLAPIDDG